ncbi:MAG TPA: type I restriction endonuclease subunit M [Lacipirellulaceae bacterium]|nr:type I restriction endonuclease subunit M [Lacipirellulaceae bacterium]
MSSTPDASTDTPVQFPLGRTVITANALATLPPDDVPAAIRRHVTGDWGELCPEDREENERSLREGGRLFSVYRDRGGVKFWVITECDRSVTTVLLPEDY